MASVQPNKNNVLWATIANPIQNLSFVYFHGLHGKTKSLFW